MSNQRLKEQTPERHDDENAISVRNVSKSYRVYEKNGDLLREIISGRRYHFDHWALRNISFDIPRGSVVGVVGPNGSGKSTLLRIVAGRLDATLGSVTLKGRTAILELGAGFHPDFTGRQNIITAGMYLGMSRDQIEENLPWIIDFSELHSVIDQPFRTYSSGMQARLTFTTAVANIPDVLIIDEALAAGDAYFVAKSFNRIRDICSSGTTVLLVSHGTNHVASLCSQAIWLEDGEMREIGPAREVARNYDYSQHVRISGNKGKIVEIELLRQSVDNPEAASQGQRNLPELARRDLDTPTNAITERPAAPTDLEPVTLAEAESHGPPQVYGPALQTDAAPQPRVDNKSRVYRRGPIVIERVIFTSYDDHTPDVFHTWEPMRIAVNYRCDGLIPNETLGLAIGIQRESDNQLVAQFNTNNLAGNETVAYDEAPFRRKPKQSGIISAYFERLQILAGDYLVSVGLMPNIPSLVDFYEYHHQIYRIRVESGPHRSGALFYPVVNWSHRPETCED